MIRSSRALLFFVLVGCSSSGNEPASPADTGVVEATALFDLGADFDDPAHFYDFPYPSISVSTHAAHPGFGRPTPTARSRSSSSQTR